MKPPATAHTVGFTNAHVQIHKYKFTNTQIQPVMKCRKYPTCVIFLKSQGSKDIKHDILNCQIHKYKCTNTNAQIHKYKFKKASCGKDWREGRAGARVIGASPHLLQTFDSNERKCTNIQHEFEKSFVLCCKESFQHQRENVAFEEQLSTI